MFFFASRDHDETGTQYMRKFCPSGVGLNGPDTEIGDWRLEIGFWILLESIVIIFYARVATPGSPGFWKSSCSSLFHSLIIGPQGLASTLSYARCDMEELMFGVQAPKSTSTSTDAYWISYKYGVDRGHIILANLVAEILEKNPSRSGSSANVATVLSGLPLWDIDKIR